VIARIFAAANNAAVTLDVVIEATGSPAAMAQAVHLATGA